MNLNILDLVITDKVLVIKNLSVDCDELTIEFENAPTVIISDDGQSCCERRYMNTDDELSYFKGATLQNVEVRDGPTEPGEDYDNDIDSQFLVVTTSKGSFTVVNYNQHNGYYGRFSVIARLA